MGSLNEETAYPKIKPSKKANPRIPPSHASSWGTTADRPQKGERPLGTYALKAVQTASDPLPFRISSLCREGAKGRGASWTLYAKENNLQLNRIKLAFPRLRPSRSVVRNRHRRRIREALRQLTQNRKGWDFFLVAKKIPQRSFELLTKELERLLRQIGYLP